jgi:hypothetical protein
MIEREKAYKLSENPGPGTYAAEKVKVVTEEKDKALNSFTTKIERFCPTQAGCSIYNAPTYVKNPGPGTHFNSLKFMGHAKSTDAKREAYGSKTNKGLATIPDAVPPGIPGKKVAPNAYTHKGFDKVGPALYNPN